MVPIIIFEVVNAINLLFFFTTYKFTCMHTQGTIHINAEEASQVAQFLAAGLPADYGPIPRLFVSLHICVARVCVCVCVCV